MKNYNIIYDLEVQDELSFLDKKLSTKIKNYIEYVLSKNPQNPTTNNDYFHLTGKQLTNQHLKFHPKLDDEPRLKSIRFYDHENPNKQNFERIIYYVVTKQKQVLIFGCTNHEYWKALERFWKSRNEPIRSIVKR